MKQKRNRIRRQKIKKKKKIVWKVKGEKFVTLYVVEKYMLFSIPLFVDFFLFLLCVCTVNISRFYVYCAFFAFFFLLYFSWIHIWACTLYFFYFLFAILSSLRFKQMYYFWLLLLWSAKKYVEKKNNDKWISENGSTRKKTKTVILSTCHS